MKSRFALAVIVGAGLAMLVLRLLPAAPDIHLALDAGHTAQYRQTFELIDAFADGEALPDLRVEHDVTLHCTRPAGEGEGAWNVAIEYGRTRVWVDELDGEPPLDTTDQGYAAVAEISESAESAVDAEVATFWATSVGTTSTCVVDKHGYVAERAIDHLVATRLDDNRAADVGSALLEDALSDPALLFAQLAHGDGPWQSELQLVAPLWGPGVTIETDTDVTDRTDEEIALTLAGTAQLNPVWSALGAEQRNAAKEETAQRKLQLPRLRITGQSFAGTATIATKDGLPNALAWTLTVELRDDGDEAWREAATLRYTLERVNRR
jgi:hypothetical protein